MRIRNFIFGASIIVSILFFGGSYLLLDRIFGETVRTNAARTSEAAAKVTFVAMYQLMSQGWSRSQADAFVQDTARAGSNDLSVQIYRSPLVTDLFGQIGQPPLDDVLKQAMASGTVER